MSRYEFDRGKSYRLIAIKDRSGRDKSTVNSFYAGRINCVAVDLRYDRIPVYGTTDCYRMKMRFVRNADGQPVQRSLHTSVVRLVERTERGLTIYTENSVYVMEEAEINAIISLDAASLIELYLSLEEDDHFAAGFYYDGKKQVHSLMSYVNTGMFMDSVLIGTYEESMYGSYVCRYYLQDSSVEFYNTIYFQQDYSTPMLIHNVGNFDLPVQFEFYPKIWTIPPGESKRIIPFHPEGADAEEEQKKK